MTNTKNMPERLWALVVPDWEDGDGEQFVGGTWDAGHFQEGQEYVHRGLHDTAVYAAMAAAYGAAADWVELYENNRSWVDWASLYSSLRTEEAHPLRTDALEAYRRQARDEARRVKPLVWEGDGHWASGPDEGWMEEATTTFGWGYSIEFDRDGNFMVDSTFDWSKDGFDTPDEAKAAAQADYERRILSALIGEGE